MLKKIILMMMVAVSFTLLSWVPDAGARSSYYDSNCSRCHGTTSTCAGCHAHGVHTDSNKDDINLTAGTDKASYSAGEQVNVTVDGGYRSGWVRVVLLDQNNVEVARSSGTGFPVTLSAPAPDGGTYTWSAAWYGNQYDAGNAAFGNGWVPDNKNQNHGWQIVETNSFTVAAAAVPSIQLQPSSLDFGSITAGGSATISSQVRNAGTADLIVSNIRRCNGTSSEYTSSPSSLTVAPGGSQTLSVTYSPTDAGTDDGCLSIDSNDPGAPSITLSLTGNGTVTPQSSTVDLDISRFSVSKRASLKRMTTVGIKLVVVNSGTTDGSAPATLVGTQGGAEVYNQTITVSVPAGSTGRYKFPEYLPTAMGEINWTVTIADEDPDDDTATAVTTVAR